MGSSNSSHHQHCHSRSVPNEMGRGWTQSFPRELNRHHVQQPSSNKVLPEPSNQRLRTTNNGNIIHNGGTISGRRSTLTLPHDLNKGIYRSRSTSASNIDESRGRVYNQRNQHCCAGHYHPCDGSCRDEVAELKRFGSEPDLRYSPTEPRRLTDTRPSNIYYPERETRERESRYRSKKKYKAPMPPINGDGSSPESYKWEIIGVDQRDYCIRHDDENNNNGSNGNGNGIVQAPPRRSRLFKTRAETKKQPSNWSTPTSLLQQDGDDSILENERKWRSEKQQFQQQQQQQQISGEENQSGWRGDFHEQNRWSRDERINLKKFNGKNTLQRSLSSPEFQAELVQVARKVRNKLYYNGQMSPVDTTAITNNTVYKIDSVMSKSMDRKLENTSRQDIEIDQRREKRKNKINEESFDTNNRDGIRASTRFYEEKKFRERSSGDGSRGKNRVIRSQEIRSYEERTMDDSRETRANDHLDERLKNGDGVGVSRRRFLEKSTTFEENIISNDNVECLFERMSMNNRVDDINYIKDQQPNSIKQLKEFDYTDDRSKTSGPFVKTRINSKPIGHARTRSESPVMRQSRDRMDVRGQGSGRESTPEPPKGKEKKVADNRHKRTNVKDENYEDCEKRWSVRSDCRIEKIQTKSYEKNNINESKEIEKNWKLSNCNNNKNSSRNVRNMNHQQQSNRIQSRIQNSNYSKSQSTRQNEINAEKNYNEDIALKLRPTLPKKQLEIPRFSPSAAWRLLSALETPAPATSSASEEVPVMYEENIERMSRPPPPPLLITLGPRSSHDKSGDSGVSCDAGVPNDDSPDVSTNRMKAQATRPTWTPQQDLGEESSSDAGVDSPPPMVPDVKFSPRAHVFSLSLPRDDNRHCSYTLDKSKCNNTSFNSLQKIKRSVSGAFGHVSGEFDRKRPGETLNDNWVLSTSAPTSLQHNLVNQNNYKDNVVDSKRGWDMNYVATDFEDEALGENEEKTEFPVVMKPPSFSYLASGGHVMYLPALNSIEHRTQSLNYRNSVDEIGTKMNNINAKHIKPNEQVKNGSKNNFINGFCNGFNNNNNRSSVEKSRESSGLQRERSFTDLGNNNSHWKHSNFSKSCENISEMRQRNCSPSHHRFAENLQDKPVDTGNLKVTIKPNPKGKRFTFQSTVRQIERRRLAEKLSREAEAKERQRRSELEAMRKVEEEFQRKRAKEKANIRQQLRLYSLDESSSLPPASDSTPMSRADPDGAPSSSASSPTSASPGKLAVNNRKGSVNNEDYHRKKEYRTQQQKYEPREYKDYRTKYYDWTPNNETSSHLEIKQTTVHPKVVCDIPKSSHVFIDANVHASKSVNLMNSTPRSDNYRKDFAHGAVAGRSSLASSDSELSQPNTRPHSRQNGNKTSKPVRTREESSSPKDNTERKMEMTTCSTSPPRSLEVASSEEEILIEETTKQERNPTGFISGIILNSIQPFVRDKSYRPISFHSQFPLPSIPS